MTAGVTELLAECRAVGVAVEAVGGKLLLRRQGGVPAALVARASAHKADLLAALGQDRWRRWEAAAWPEACLASERLYGQRHARLFPLIRGPGWEKYHTPGLPSGRVQTTRGPGLLRSVFAGRADVALDAGPKGEVTSFHPSEVWPADVGLLGVEP